MAATDVVSLDAALAHLNMQTLDDADELAGHISAASELVDQMIGPVVIRECVDYERSGRRIALDQRPVVELVEVVATDTGATIVPGGLRVARDSGVVRWRRGGRLVGGPFDITYRAGRVADADGVEDGMPAVRLACLVIVAHLWETQRAPTLGPGMSPEDFTEAPPGAGYAIPYRARDLLMPYMTTVVV